MADQETTAGGTGTEGLEGASKLAPSPATLVPKPENIAEEVGLPVREIAQVPAPARAPENDLARILKEVKLPERKEFRATADPLLSREAQPLDTSATQEPEPSPAEPKSRETVSAIHTLKDDFQSAVYDNKISLVQAAALEETKRTHKRPDEISLQVNEERRKRALGTVIAITALVLLGAIALGATLLIISDRAGVTPATFLVEGLLFSEQTIPIDVKHYSAAELKRQLVGLRTSSNLTLGAITRVAPLVEETDASGEKTQREATAREFFAALDAHVPEELLRALGDTFFFGFHTVDENAPLIIVPVTSYERAFAGMLAWESTMNADLAPMFTSVPSLVRTNDGLLVARAFSDTVMRNYDVRTLKDDSGIVQLYYSFPTRGILIISESQYSFAETLSRLRADRRL